MIGNEKYCLNNKVKVLWVDKTFGLAKVSFVDEGIEKIVGIGLITEQPREESTLCLSILTEGGGGITMRKMCINVESAICTKKKINFVKIADCYFM